MCHTDSSLNRRADVNKTFNREIKVNIHRKLDWT